MPGPNPIYYDYQLLKEELLEAAPHLTLITTKEQFDADLDAREGPASHVKIEMANCDNVTATATAKNFVNKHVLNHSEAQKKLNFEAMIINGCATREREEESIQDLTEFLLLEHNLKMVSLIDDVENGAADAYIYSKGDDLKYVGCQLTRVTTSSSPSDTGHCTINKSKDQIVDYVLVKGFILFIMLYVDDIWRGIAFLHPDDKELIESLPSFTNIGIYQGRGGDRKRFKFQSGSFCEKLANAKRLFLWPSSPGPPADWFRDVKSFLKNPTNKKYSIQEFNLMLNRNGHIEFMYIEAFKKLFPDTKRLKAAHFGDIAFTVQTLSIEAEFKLLIPADRPSPKAGWDYLFACCYRSNHSLTACANKVSTFAFAIAEKKLPTKQSEIGPNDFTYFVLVPTRTSNGKPNVASSHVKGMYSSVFLLFDRKHQTLEEGGYSKRSLENLQEYIVLVPGQPIDSKSLEMLKEWSRRPKCSEETEATPATTEARKRRRCDDD
jgi:hypothetical protein